MKNYFAPTIRFAAAAGVLLTLTSGLPAHAIETACVASGGTNCPALIPDGPLPGISSTITVPAGVCGANAPSGVSVRVNVTHNWIGDLTLAVRNPANVSSTLISSLAGAPSVSCAGDDISATFQDGGAAPSCQSATVPSLSGTVAPASALAPLLASTTGVWTLTVTDNAHANNGAIADWAVDLACGPPPAPADMSVALNGFPSTGVPGATVNGTITCTNIGGQAATGVTCSAVNGITSACALQPGNTPIAGFPVASVAVGSSITCNLSTVVSGAGLINVTGNTSATNDGNSANNSAAFAASGAPVLVPTLSNLMMLLLALLVGAGAMVSLMRKRAEAI